MEFKVLWLRITDNLRGGVISGSGEHKVEVNLRQMRAHYRYSFWQKAIVVTSVRKWWKLFDIKALMFDSDRSQCFHKKLWMKILSNLRKSVAMQW